MSTTRKLRLGPLPKTERRQANLYVPDQPQGRP